MQVIVGLKPFQNYDILLSFFSGHERQNQQRKWRYAQRDTGWKKYVCVKLSICKYTKFIYKSCMCLCTSMCICMWLYVYVRTYYVYIVKYNINYSISSYLFVCATVQRLQILFGSPLRRHRCSRWPTYCVPLTRNHRGVAICPPKDLPGVSWLCEEPDTLINI